MPSTPAISPQLQLLQRFADAARDVILICDAEPIDLSGPRVLYANPAFTRMTGYEPEEILGKTPRLLHGLDTDHETLRRVRGHLERWEPFRAELLNYRKDGTPFWVEIDVQPLADDTGLYTHWVAVQRDITERKQTEQQIFLEHFALSQVSDAVIAVGNDYRVIYWNEAATRFYGVSAEAARGKYLRDIYTYQWDSAEAESEAMRQLREMGSYRGTFVHVCRDGRQLPVECSVTLLRNASGEAVGYVGIIRDDSDRLRAEQALIKSRRILRDVLCTATEQRLILCDTHGDLPVPLGERMAMVTVTDPTHLRCLRDTLREAACAAQFTPARAADITMATHESMMNALVHGGGGTATIFLCRRSRRLQVWITDTGSGIDPDILHRATLERGYTTSGGFGHGFPMMLSLADRIYLHSGCGGTTVVVEQSEDGAFGKGAEL